MAFPLPDSWMESAFDILEEYYDGEILPSSDEEEAEDEGGYAEDDLSDKDEQKELSEDQEYNPTGTSFLDKFKHTDFREGFFKAIGHRYFMAIQRILTQEEPTERFTQEKWRDNFPPGRPDQATLNPWGGALWTLPLAVGGWFVVGAKAGWW